MRSKQALTTLGWMSTKENAFDVGVVMGTGIGGIQSLIDGIMTVVEKGIDSVSPLLLPMMLPDSPTGKIAIDFGLRGPNLSIATACATGNNCIGEATELIRRGSATVHAGWQQ